MLPILPVSILLAVLVVLVAFLTLVATRLLRKLKHERRHHDHIHDQLVSYRAAVGELTRSLYVYRNIFDHYGEYVPLEPKLDRLLFSLSEFTWRYAQALPNILTPHWTREGEAVPSMPHLGYLLEDNHAVAITGLVRELHDPVLSELWKVRTPTAVCEMIRHTFFLAFGYSDAVAGPSLHGVLFDPRSGSVPIFTNWGSSSLPKLTQELEGLWAEWRERAPLPDPNLPRSIATKKTPTAWLRGVWCELIEFRA